MMPVLRNTRHELYCRGVVEGKTGDRAYADAGYKPGRNNAARLRANENIQARIKELQKRGLERHDITVDRIIEEYVKIGFSDIRKIFDEEGNPLKPHEMDASTAGALSSFKVSATGEVDVRLADKRMALLDLGKHFNIFKEVVTIKAEVVHKTVSDLELARRLAYLIAKGAHRS